MPSTRVASATSRSIRGCAARAPAGDSQTTLTLSPELCGKCRSIRSAVGDSKAGVELAFEPDALLLEVTNPLPDGAAPGGEGYGLVGMRERAALVGGSLEAGAEDGRFRLRARLPSAEVAS